ncbi:hypothetical protein HN415_08980 [Candidatus Woesearchaeota archaeon]|jgi:hypothetical protein|nr:hypothetical protein [Candidatus Woesearchaeota archaeon]
MTNKTLMEKINNDQIGRLFLQLTNNVNYSIKTTANGLGTEKLYKHHFVEIFQKKYDQIRLKIGMNPDTLNQYISDDQQIFKNYTSENPVNSLSQVLGSILDKYNTTKATALIGEIIKKNPLVNDLYEKPSNSKRLRRKQLNDYNEIYSNLKQKLNFLL